MSKPLFERIAVIGLGLMGSSFALNVRHHGLATEVLGFDAASDVRKRARPLDIFDRVTRSAKEAVENADLVMICVPVGVIGDVAKQLAPHLKKGAIVTDVGSVKGRVIEDVSPHIPESVTLVPGHPIAGTERSGPEAATPGLFEGRWVILTPAGGGTSAEVERVKALWEGLGSGVEVMAPERHDLVLAITSHVPHLIAYNIVGTAADLETVTQSEVIKYSAGGFRDFTRIAASDPTMWRDIFLTNKDAVLEMLGRFSEDLAALQRAIRWDDGEGLFDLFTRTRAIRREIIEAGQDEDAPDFGRFHGELGEALQQEILLAGQTAEGFDKLRVAFDDAVARGIIELGDAAARDEAPQGEEADQAGSPRSRSSKKQPKPTNP